MTLGRCPLSIFCSRGTPPRESGESSWYPSQRIRQPTLSLSPAELFEATQSQASAQYATASQKVPRNKDREPSSY